MRFDEKASDKGESVLTGDGVSNSADLERVASSAVDRVATSGQRAPECAGCANLSKLLGLKNVVILGSTGSIGTQTIDVVRQHPEKLQVIGLAAGTNGAKLLEQAKLLKVGNLALASRERITDEVFDALLGQTTDASHYLGSGGSFGLGNDAVAALAELPEADIVVNALVGEAGLRASLTALKAGKVLALANKESLVVGGDLIMPLAQEPGRLMPIDSEHGAIYQCLLGENPREVSKLWVTASGGPFRGCTCDELAHVAPAQALAHPTWHMGPKITIDSSTLMNKGLEVIEAHHLFNMPYERIEVVVQPQSAIHSMVEFTDGSVKAHLGTTDMRIPIQFALSYPERWSAPVEPLDFRTLGSLQFEAPDTKTFRALDLAYHAGKTGGTLPCVMNAANEVAVASFLAEHCAYLDIATCVSDVMEAHEVRGVQTVESLEQLQEIDTWARAQARDWVTAHTN